MTDKKMPAFRNHLPNARQAEVRLRYGLARKFPDSYDISPVLEWSGGQYPKMALAEAPQAWRRATGGRARHDRTEA